MKPTPAAAAGLALLAACLMTVGAAADIHTLPIGDPERRDRRMPVALDRISDTRAAEQISATALISRLASADLVFFGESHTDMDMHRAQLQLIRGLHAAGREVLVGLEMIPYTHQAALDRWTSGELDEAGFLDAADWYESWGYRWEYYADIFRYARDQGLRMYGVNAPRRVIQAVRTDNLETLSERDRRQLPAEVREASDDFRSLFLASFKEDDPLHADISEARLAGMLRAQAAWDAVMGWNAVNALREQAGADAIMIVLIGSGHVAYGLGAQRQIESEFEGRVASLIPMPVADADGEPIDAVQASLADFVWGMPASRPPAYPSLGISLAGVYGDRPNQVIRVDKDGPAGSAGLRAGDLLLEVDGRPVASRAALRELMSHYYWADSAMLRIGRGERVLERQISFRRAD